MRDLPDLELLLGDRTKLVCFTHCSNIVGLVHDVKSMVRRIHEAGALACVALGETGIARNLLLAYILGIVPFTGFAAVRAERS